MIDEGHNQSEEFQKLIDEVNGKWEELARAVAERKRRLELSEVAQQVSVMKCNAIVDDSYNIVLVIISVFVVRFVWAV